MKIIQIDFKYLEKIGNTLNLHMLAFFLLLQPDERFDFLKSNLRL